MRAFGVTPMWTDIIATIDTELACNNGLRLLSDVLEVLTKIALESWGAGAERYLEDQIIFCHSINLSGFIIGKSCRLLSASTYSISTYSNIYRDFTKIVLTAIVAPFFPIPPVRIVATFPDKIKHAHEHIVLKHRSACLTLKPENVCRLK